MAGRASVPRPPLFFKETWQQTPKPDQHPATQQSVSNPSLELKLYVPSGEVLLTGDEGNENNPVHVWLGMCTSPCAVALREKNSFALIWCGFLSGGKIGTGRPLGPTML